MNTLRFEIAGDCLYAANSGRAFDRTDVVSLCSQHLSAKSARADKIATLDCSDADLVDAIRRQRIELYTLDPNLLLSDRNAEEETSRDYAGRCLLELLQNGDDAMAPLGAARGELIGAKGLGFKAVLEITDNPQVFSGPFRFGFDQALSRACLGHLEVGDEVSVFRIPHSAESDPTVERLLSEGFTTVVKLPLRDVDARAYIERELADLRPHFLLLAQHMEAVDIRSEMLRRTLLRSGDRGTADGADAVLTVRSGRKTLHETQWRVWREVWPAPGDAQKRLSVGMAIQTMRGQLVPCDAGLPLHVFYPTEEELDANFLIHAACEVTQNRQRVRQGPNDAELLLRLAALTKRVAVSQPPLEVLQVFRGLIAAAPKNKPKLLPRLIQFTLRQSLLDAEFVPVIGRGSRRLSPRLARTATAGFGALLNANAKSVAEAGIIRPELEPALPVLNALESRTLDTGEYARLFGHVRCTGADACEIAARAMLRICLAQGYVAPTTLAALKEAPIWPVLNGGVRALVGSRPLLLSRPPDWPDWCEVDAIEPAFAEAIFPGGAVTKEWDKLVSGLLLTSREQHLERCIAPAVARWGSDDWSAFGWDALMLVESWAGPSDWSKVKPYAPQAGLGSVRDALVAVMRVPTNRGWFPARSCYARSEIKGPGCLSRHFRLDADRALCGYPGEAKRWFTADRWRALLRYLGVSWEPKILLLSGAKSGVEEPLSAEFMSDTHNQGIRYLHKDWCLEQFPACLGEQVPAATLMEMIASAHLTVSDLRGEWRKVQGTDKTHLPSPYDSYAQFQLRKIAYLPVKPNVWGKALAKGAEAYWPQSGLKGITPDLELAGFKDPRRAALRPALSAALMFKTKLPERWVEWLAWNAALVKAVESGTAPVGVRSVREFYELMLDPKHGGKDGSEPQKVVCVDPTSPSGLRAVPRAEAAWIDRPSLAAPEVLDALAAAGLPYLPALLNAGAGAEEQLGVPRASKKVDVAPRYDDAPTATARLTRRLEARWRAIAVQCETKRVRLPSRPELRAVHGLTLAISLGGTPVTVVASAAYKVGEEWLIDLANEWDALASALADGLGHGADLRYRFAAILKAPNQETVVRLLLEDGIPGYKLATLKFEDDEDGGEDGTNDPGAGSEAAQVVATAQDPVSPTSDTGETSVGAAPPDTPSSTTVEDRRPAGDRYASGSLTHRPLYDPPAGSGSGSRGGGSGSRQFEAGLAGEVWLRQLMAAKLPQGWTLSLNERDQAAGESDIVLRSPSAEWHVEVKTLSSERIYWSDLERAKAQRQRGRYWMCFLVRQGYAWRIHWSWDPLLDLLACERRVQWQWARESEGPRLSADSWEPIGGVTAPNLPPDRATAVIRILDPQVRTLPQDDEALRLFWERVRSTSDDRASGPTGPGGARAESAPATITEGATE